MTDTFNPECANCKITIGRIEKWVDHINCPPNKWQLYDLMKSFVEMVVNETSGEHSETSAKECLTWLSFASRNLLMEIKEDELLRSNGFAESRKESNTE